MCDVRSKIVFKKRMQILFCARLFFVEYFPLRKDLIDFKRGCYMAIKNLSIRIDEEMLDKLHIVADYEARSANGQIIVLIRECIEKYEEKYGEIVLGQKKVEIHISAANIKEW